MAIEISPRILFPESLRRRTPLAARLLLTELDARAQWWRARADRCRNLARVELLLRGAPRSASNGSVARRHAVVCDLSDTLIHQEHLLDRMRFVGREHFERARVPGAIFATIHSPTQWLSARAAYEAGEALEIVVDDWVPMTDAAVPQEYLRRTGGAFEKLSASLQAGGNCAILFDVPGETEVQFVHKRAMLRNGMGRLAVHAQRSIVPCIVYWEGRHPVVRFCPPIEPDGATPDALLQRVADTFTEILVERPELWTPHTSQLWPEHRDEYRWAFPN